jgi:hypothetical protein
MAIDTLFHAAQANALEHPVQFLLLSAIVLPIAYVVVNEFVRRQARVPGLDGPKGLPLIGNLWQIRVNAAEKYRQWSRKYGAVYQIQLGNVPIVVVNSAASAKVLFGQNAQALSSRPEFYTFHKASFRGNFHYWTLGLQSTGSLEYGWYYDRNLALQRVPKETKERRRIRSQQTLHPNIHTPP